MSNGKLKLVSFTTRDSEPCIPPAFLPASKRLPEEDALRRSGNKAARRLATLLRHVLELTASLLLRRGVPDQSRRPMRPTLCAWHPSSLRRVDSAELTHPTLSFPIACDNPTARDGTKAEMLPGRSSNW